MKLTHKVMFSVWFCTCLLLIFSSAALAQERLWGWAAVSGVSGCAFLFGGLLPLTRQARLEQQQQLDRVRAVLALYVVEPAVEPLLQKLIYEMHGVTRSPNQ